MADSQGFWSYVHADDAADGGRITRLVYDIASQFEMMTNESIRLFLDRDDIEWGDEWRAQIDGSLASVAFFIPVLTPRYFASAVCRSEFNTFARRATDLGVEQLLLPILYVDFPGLNDDEPDDELIAMVKRFQWVDWRDLRFADAHSPEYRRGVSALASRLVEANRAAERTAASDDAISRAETIDEEIGGLDLLAAFETAVPALTETTGLIGEAIAEVSAAATRASESVNASNDGQSFAKRLLILRGFASDLADPSARIKELGEDFARQLHDVDLGVRIIIERAPDEPESAHNFEKFFGEIRSMVESADTGLTALETLISTIAPLEKLSRDTRPPFRNLRHGLTLMVEGRNVMRKWVELIDEMP